MINKPANIFDRLLHFLGLRKYWLVGIHEREIKWIDLERLEEKITFYLFEDTKGKRFYKVHDYGFCRLRNKYIKYLGPIIAWMNGHHFDYIQYSKDMDINNNEK